jgi:rhodanese-related sulfurtransferase
VLLLDVREPAETARGIIPSALLVARGKLEFAADPTGPDHAPELDPARRAEVQKLIDAKLRRSPVVVPPRAASAARFAG